MSVTASIVNYYAVLTLPPNADLNGIENAYARLSDELATAAGGDEDAAEHLAMVNEAYAVLSVPERRRKYDMELFRDRVEETERREHEAERRRTWLRAGIYAVFTAVVVAQLAALLVIGGDEVGEAARTIIGPLLPESAG